MSDARGEMRGLLRTMTAAIFIAAAAAAAAQTKLVDTFNDWYFYSHEGSNERVCFAASAPQSSEPAGVSRDPAYFYISAWPKEGVRTELSVKIGYPFREGSEAKVTIGNETFTMFTHEDRAFVNNPIEELKLLEAMKRGSTMVVEGVTEQGTSTRDTFSLLGVTKAVQTLTSQCG